MKIRLCALAAAASIAVAAVPGDAHHGSSCSLTVGAPYARKQLRATQGTVDAVQAKQIDVYQVRGATNVVVLAAGDVDISMCVVGSAGNHVCQSDEVGLFPEGCTGLHPGVTYRLDVKHCLDRGCGWPDVPASVAYSVVMV